MSSYRCVGCGKSYLGPCGQCDQCGSRKIQPVKEGLVNRAPAMLASDLAKLEASKPFALEPILDQALSFGSRLGFSILLAGNEGSGKSTIAASACAHFTRLHDFEALYASSEETSKNVADRMQRLNLYSARTWVMSDSMGESIFTETKPLRKLLIVDSINGYSYKDQSCAFGSAAVEFCKAIHLWAMETGSIAIVICQANKEGEQVGPRALAHCVDATLTFWKSSVEHSLTTGKNRHGRAPVTLDVMLDEKGMRLRP